ncbi:hypothetical protein D3870_05275 [Noviherbaspirillum cavernae]|uniref:Uncharacterized protein n=1 Tax=Noviherbaspirillum cavernae TaxID=2320862 RepID=A0A418X656_9BURK|nr:hypothetical protein D3870_05275 [Noviherbaspirillum cavernae]
MRNELRLPAQVRPARGRGMGFMLRLSTHPPLQGAQRLASLCCSAGEEHAPRNPCVTPNPPLEGEGT